MKMIAAHDLLAQGADVSPLGDRLARLRSLAIARDSTAVGAPLVPAPTSERSVPRNRWLIGIVAVQAVAIGGLIVHGNQIGATPAAAAARATSAPATAAGVGQFDAQGFITATRRATVSTRVAGIVTSVPVEAGDHVVRGQIVGTLDADLANRDLLLAERQVAVVAARLRSAEAQGRQATAEVAREQPLFEKQFSTRAHHLALQTSAEVATAAQDSARADLAVAELQVAQQRSLLGNYTIKAPFAGIVIEKNAQPGELIAPSGAVGGFTRTGLCTIVDMDSLEAIVDVNEQLITRVRVGQPVKLSLYAHPDATFAARVARIMPSADRAKGTLQVRINIDRPDGRILPDMGARVTFL